MFRERNPNVFYYHVTRLWECYLGCVALGRSLIVQTSDVMGTGSQCMRLRERGKLHEMRLAGGASAAACVGVVVEFSAVSMCSCRLVEMALFSQ